MGGKGEAAGETFRVRKPSHPSSGFLLRVSVGAEAGAFLKANPAATFRLVGGGFMKRTHET
jgi:hypothetical protein